jgi:hypothetical protein
MTRSPARIVGILALFTGGCGTPTGPSATLSQVSLASTSVVAGASSEGTLTLSGAAPGGGVPVTISSSDGAATVPASLTVSAGSSTATFTVQTRVIAADTNATITVAVGGQTRAVTLHIIAPVPRPASLEGLVIDPSALKGGQSARGTVLLTSAATVNGFIVNLRSSNSVATVRANLTVPPCATSATFVVVTGPVQLETQLEIAASAGDVARTVPLHVTP